MGVSGMTGTPWHKERATRNGDERRHRTHCKHYNHETKRCAVKFIKCFGSAHCDRYERKRPSRDSNTSNNNRKNRHSLPLATSSNRCSCSNSLIKNYYQIGDRILHKEYGNGVVRDFIDDSVTLAFDDGSERTIPAMESLQKSLVRKINPRT